jgi:SynChlorMet cassette protein ScmD
MQNDSVVIMNPVFVLREEDDDWALLVNPDTVEVFGLNPTAVHILKHFDGVKTTNEVITNLIGEFKNVPLNAAALVTDFIDRLFEKGIVEYKKTGSEEQP